jgi:glucose/arabinose dehydrogenase
LSAFLWAGSLRGADLPYHPQVAYPKLTFQSPLFVTVAPGLPSRLFVVEQDGRLVWFDDKPDASQALVALDISKKVRRSHLEEGLLGLAFHPDFAKNRTLFVVYSASDPQRTVLARFRMNAAGTVVDPSSETVLLEQRKSFGNHNGGMIAFGPDGFLYMSLGDGGGAGDQSNNAQNLGTLLGKIIRIDVNRRSEGRAYAIPDDNPFIATKGARPEIWAYGLRNVWRFSFDRETNHLWAGDVGQDSWEEIDLITRGENYGWNFREGFHSFGRRPPTTGAKFIDPVAEHGRDAAQSITGGYVYRGTALPGLRGQYIYGDFMTGKIWSIPIGEAKVVTPMPVAQGKLISSFGEGPGRELLFTSFDGNLYRLVP